MGNINIWLTPIWLLSVGFTAGALILLVLFGLLWLVNRNAGETAGRLVKESILGWVSYLLIAFAVFCVIAIPMMPAREVIRSLGRLPQVGTIEQTVEIPARTDDKEVQIEFSPEELQSYSFTSEQDLVIGVEKGKAYAAPLIRVEGGEPYVWTPGSKRPRHFEKPITALFVTNQSDAPTKLTIQVDTDVPLLHVRQIPIAAASVVGLYLVYMLIHWLLPGISTIALATAKEAVAQPLFLLITLIAAFLLVAYIYIPYNTFGEDVKMYKDSSLMTIKVGAILLALWTASVSVAEEIEGRTALTLLSKPISRRQFVLGKFVGIIWAILLFFILLGLWMLLFTSYKVIYDARETSNPEPIWQVCSSEVISIVPGLVLAFMETVVLAAISVAISTRLSMLPNLVIVGSIFALGHLGPLIVQSSVGQNEFVSFFGQLVALVLPVLDHFDIQSAVAGGVRVPPDYLAWALLYCVLYSTVAMLLALILFEDRDLA